MSWRQLLTHYLGSTAVASVAITGSYVIYQDYMRYPRMISTYSRGNILPPLSKNKHEIRYCPRESVEKILTNVFSSKICNEFYVVTGEVGTGKSRTILEIVRRMIETSGQHHQGAPIYISVTQGTSFPETLAAAIHFNFDEHINFNFFLNFLFRVQSVPDRDDDSRLTRVLNAVERSAYGYLQQTGRQVVLIIDGVENLPTVMPGALEKVTDKAKLWADCGIVKVVFVNNDEKTELILQNKSSNWSRASTPIIIPDLSREEALSFLTNPFFFKGDVEQADLSLPRVQAERLVDLVGGRLHQLIVFKRNYLDGISVDDTAEQLKEQEREKFLDVSKLPSTWQVISILRESPDNQILLSRLIKRTRQSDVMKLASHNIIKFDRGQSGVTVQFQSALTKVVVEEYEQHYAEEKKRQGKKVKENDNEGYKEDDEDEKEKKKRKKEKKKLKKAAKEDKED